MNMLGEREVLGSITLDENWFKTRFPEQITEIDGDIFMKVGGGDHTPYRSWTPEGYVEEHKVGDIYISFNDTFGVRNVRKTTKHRHQITMDGTVSEEDFYYFELPVYIIINDTPILSEYQPGDGDPGDPFELNFYPSHNNAIDKDVHEAITEYFGEQYPEYFI